MTLFIVGDAEHVVRTRRLSCRFHAVTTASKVWGVENHQLLLIIVRVYRGCGAIIVGHACDSARHTPSPPRGSWKVDQPLLGGTNGPSGSAEHVVVTQYSVDVALCP